MTKRPENGFDNLEIAPNLLKAIYRLKYTIPTPVQERAIPLGIEGKDIIALAQTGSGKTVAFGIPMLQRLARLKRGGGLVLVPTRELAVQVDEALHTLGASMNLRSVVLIGGASMAMQLSVLKKNPRIIIATPGRLLDHVERRTVDLSNIDVFVLDEADRMLDMGFVPDIKKIMKALPANRQTMLFSATMPKEIEAIVEKLMTDPIRIEIDRSGATPAEVSQEIFFLKNQDKGRLLTIRMRECTGPVLVFTRTKHMAKKLTSRVNDLGFYAAEIHSNRTLGQRQNALEGFKRGRYQILIATDIAARGIDVSGIELVVNYDMPANPEDYVHRIGRTGRAGKKGHAISFANTSQKSIIRSLERFMKTKVAITKLPKLPSEKQLLEDAEELIEKKAARVAQFARRTKPTRQGFSKERPSRNSDFKRRDSRKFAAKRTDSDQGGYRGKVSNRPDSRRSDYRRTESNSPMTKRIESEQSGYRRQDSQHVDSRRTDSNRPISNRDDSKRPFTKHSESRHAEAKRPFAKRADSRRTDSTQTDSRRPFTKGNDSDRRDSRRPNEGRPDYKRPFAKKNSSDRPDYKRPFSKHTDAHGTVTKQRTSKPLNADQMDLKKAEANIENAFWADFKKKRPTKKKTSGPGGKKKRRKRF